MLMRNMYLVLNICVLIYAYRKKSYTSGCLQKSHHLFQESQVTFL